MNEKRTPEAERRILRTVIDGLSDVNDEARLRILRSAAVFFQLDLDKHLTRPTVSPLTQRLSNNDSSDRELSFAAREVISPKQFLLEKQPSTDIERVACLAYYLAHYRGTEQFKTIDISKLNTEAAQLKFSNPSFSVENAAKRGFLAPGARGYKQLTAMGERFVDALPDRAAAKFAVAALRPRRLKSNNTRPRRRQRRAKG